jgi:DNA polymerase epsilon subunit 1
VLRSFCNDCRDLDLTRDEALALHDWRCRVCRQPLDTASLERRLVAGLRAEAAAYQTQDLACVKCKQVTCGHLRSLCGLCGGGLTNTRRPETADRRLVVYRNLARFHGFRVLAENAGWLLGEPEAEEGGEGGAR